jgi:hypothetical protein
MVKPIATANSTHKNPKITFQDFFKHVSCQKRVTQFSPVLQYVSCCLCLVVCLLQAVHVDPGHLKHGLHHPLGLFGIPVS